MNREVKHRMGRSAGVPPEWTSVLAVIAHPDDTSFGLGAILDAFVFAGAKVDVLCLTHGQAWTLEGAPGDLAALRGAELASAADVLGPARAVMADCPDGALGEVGQARLVDEVIASADSCFPDGLLVFDTDAVEGHQCCLSPLGENGYQRFRCTAARVSHPPERLRASKPALRSPRVAR